MKTIAVVFGGKSNENEISVLTGLLALSFLDREKFSPLPLYIHTDGEMYTSEKANDLNVYKKGDFSSFGRVILDGGNAYLFVKNKKLKLLKKIDGALNCCHGGLGEGGGVSALFEMNGIPLASPKLTPSGIFMDKSMTKLVAKALNIPTVPYIRVAEADYARRGKFLLKNIESKLKYPVVVKPANLGSSIGVTLCENEEEAAKGLEAAFLLDRTVLIEKFVTGKRDINCGAYAIGGEICVSEPEEADFGGGIYSFSDKYLKKKRKESGEPLSEDVVERIRLYTKTLYKRTDLTGIIRADYLVRGEDVYLCEVNTVPGSLAYYLFSEHMSDAKKLISDLLEEALKAEGEKHIYSTGVLESVAFTGKSRGVRL